MRANGLPYKSVFCLTILGAAAMLTGCGRSTDKRDQQKPAAAPTAGPDGEKDHADAGAADKADVAPGLADLSDADRAIAEKQKVCPVSGEQLGAMGKPVKITVKGQTVFLCCPGCEPAIKKDPDKYLKKLGKPKASDAK
jgi:hypothetical protein